MFRAGASPPPSLRRAGFGDSGKGASKSGGTGSFQQFFEIVLAERGQVVAFHHTSAEAGLPRPRRT